MSSEVSHFAIAMTLEDKISHKKVFIAHSPLKSKKNQGRIEPGFVCLPSECLAARSHRLIKIITRRQLCCALDATDLVLLSWRTLCKEQKEKKELDEEKEKRRRRRR